METVPMHADTELNAPRAWSQPIRTHTWPLAMVAVPVTLGTKVITASLSHSFRTTFPQRLIIRKQ